jgi:hypothetical protein
MPSQSCKSPNWDNFRTPLGSPETKKPFGCRCRGKAQIILYGGGWWLPLSPGHGESCEFRVAPWLVLALNDALLGPGVNPLEGSPM